MLRTLAARATPALLIFIASWSGAAACSSTSSPDIGAEAPRVEGPRHDGDGGAAPGAGPAGEPGELGVGPDSAQAPEPEPEPAGRGHDFLDEARLLLRVAACAPFDPVPEGFSEEVVAAHCARLARAVARYRERWLEPAVPFFAELVPDDAPRAVVYPFGGADLVTALAIFPGAGEITTISLEPAGDPRAPGRLSASAFRRSLTDVRREMVNLLQVNHSRTLNMVGNMRKGKLPAHLILSLHALSLHGFEPVALHYFRLRADGSIEYLAEEDLSAAEAERSQTRLNAFFASMELHYRERGDDSAPVKVYRHLLANLADDHLQRDDRVLEHLRAKGRVSAMTKAASYLLWYKSFSRIRDYLLENVDWMVSDSTGIPPRWTHPAGFELETWGRFDQPFLAPGQTHAKELRELWRERPSRPLAFRFGYPDRRGRNHQVVTRRAPARP